jgi:hypothetical protein
MKFENFYLKRIALLLKTEQALLRTDCETAASITTLLDETRTRVRLGTHEAEEEVTEMIVDRRHVDVDPQAERARELEVEAVAKNKISNFRFSGSFKVYRVPTKISLTQRKNTKLFYYHFELKYYYKLFTIVDN